MWPRSERACAIDVVLACDIGKDAVFGLGLYDPAEALFEKCVIGNSPPIGGHLIKAGKFELPGERM